MPGRWCLGRDREQIRRAWRHESLGSGWRRPDDWWVPEVDALAGALSRPTVLDDDGRLAATVPACAALGQARAEAGVGLAEALDDLAALYRTLPVGVPPLPSVRAFVESWADVWLRAVADAGCVDPLTELASRGYLHARLTELYRAAEQDGGSVPDRYRLVVATLEGMEPGWRLLLRRVAVAEALRVAFPGGETLAGLAPRRAVAVVARDQADPVGRLRAALADRREVAPVRVGTVPLPARAADLADLLGELSE